MIHYQLAQQCYSKEVRCKTFAKLEVGGFLTCSRENQEYYSSNNNRERKWHLQYFKQVVSVAPLFPTLVSVHSLFSKAHRKQDENELHSNLSPRKAQRPRRCNKYDKTNWLHLSCYVHRGTILGELRFTWKHLGSTFFSSCVDGVTTLKAKPGQIQLLVPLARPPSRLWMRGVKRALTSP